MAALSWPDSTPGHDRGGAAFADDRVRHVRVVGRRRRRAADGISQRAVVPITPIRASTRHVVVERGDVGGDVVDLVEHPAGPLDDSCALVGEAAVGAVDEGDAEFRLELGDVARTRWTAPCTAPVRRPRRCRDRRRPRSLRAGDIHASAIHHRKTDSEYRRSSTCQMHPFTCILSQEQNEARTPPMFRSRRVHNRSPIDGTFQVETPRSPIRAFPVFRRGVGPGRSTERIRCSVRACVVVRASAPTTARTGAAFFDLDRTLLRGACGEVFSARDDSAPVSSTGTIPGEKLLYRLFNTDRRDAARHGARPPGGHVRQGSFARGGASRRRDGRRPARRAWCSRSPSRCSPMHRDAGRPIVLATTTPYDLVKPFADRLGLDDVVATRYGVDADGDTYDGTLAGPFVWSAGKLAAVADMGSRARGRPGRELCLLGQRVRHAAAGRGRAPGRGQPRPADGADGGCSSVADHGPRRVAGCA